MRATRILIVGITLLAASCAALATKPVQGPGTNIQPQGTGSSQQGPSLNGSDPQGAAASQQDGRATGLKADTVRLVGGQLFSNAPLHD